MIFQTHAYQKGNLFIRNHHPVFFFQCLHAFASSCKCLQMFFLVLRTVWKIAGNPLIQNTIDHKQQMNGNAGTNILRQIQIQAPFHDLKEPFRLIQIPSNIPAFQMRLKRLANPLIIPPFFQDPSQRPETATRQNIRCREKGDAVHWEIHRSHDCHDLPILTQRLHTAAEIIVERANAEKEHMGLTSWENAPDGKIVKTDVSIAKKYLKGVELEDMGRLVNSVLDMAERMAKRHIPMTMEDWAKRIDIILEAGSDAILQDAGKITAEFAKRFAESEFEKYRIIQDKLFQSDFDRLTHGELPSFEIE